MKSAFIKVLSSMVLLSVLTLTVNAQQDQIATVDVRKVFDNFWKRKEGDAGIKAEVARMEKEHKSMLDDYKKMKDEYQTVLTSASDQAVSAEEREKRKKAAEDKLKGLKTSEDAIVQYEKAAREKMEQQVRRMRDNIISEIKNAVTGIAQKGGYSMVIDSAAETVNSTPVLLYCNTRRNDLTDTVLEQLNANAPATTPSSEEKKPEAKK